MKVESTSVTSNISVTVPPSNTSATNNTSTPSPTNQAPTIKPGGSKLLDGISINVAPPPQVAAPQKVQVEAKPLTQEDLDIYWKEIAEELNLKELMAAAEVHLGENNRTIDVQATETWFATDFRPHRIDVMELLRKKSGMPMLECNVIPRFISKGTLIYTAEEKYKAMLQVNPKLATLRHLFPEIDI